MARFFRRMQGTRGPVQYRSRFRRGRLRPTTAPLLQQCQFYFDTEVIIGTAGETQTTAALPSFFAQAMSPWTNLSQTGYDSRYDLFGFNYNSTYFIESFEASPTGSQNDVARLCELWFADSVDNDGAPSSLITSGDAFGPFRTFPPIVSPTSLGVSTDRIMPVRTLKRTYFALGERVSTNTLGGRDGGALQVHKGSGRVRVKRKLDDQQEWFWSLFGFPSRIGYEYSVRSLVGGVAYYKLRR